VAERHLPEHHGVAYDAARETYAEGGTTMSDKAAPSESLKQRLEETRLPAELKAQILAQMPSPEEEERLLCALQAGGGLSSAEFLVSLGLEVEPQP
jgi:hypothetical protein